jgi:mannose-1-phosphate guanylyltransferase/mannose-6-phosphate isomerase
LTETEYIKDLTKVSVNGYDFADYKHLFKLDKIVMSHVSVKPGESVPPHVHDNEEQTYWIIKGIGKIRLGNEEYDVCGGQAVYIPLGTEHTIKNTGQEPLEYVFFAAIF